MNDQVIQIEVALNFVNTLLSKAVAFKDNNLINELSNLRHDIYYGDVFDYDNVIGELKSFDVKLKKYE